ncbi:hypothetical protein HX004_08420 [Myroides sp. 1354]|uniref:hypothetical protein n=1 Tax=unclassified Myroides TaxID=2642485 RepID=UPI00257572AC|nr:MULTISPECIES: hypothetical protein [unclassified Myroides]MDM1046619.1 hypothetical protein [Myroides sp. R163-1]MDM1055795.1 hypothetical protein [Myroides sp. 1354]MDM1069976.1 hypothetical protein [Myroides sp. 1372]
MRKFFIFFFTVFFVLSCSVLREEHQIKQQSFILFHNDIKVISKADDDLFYDKGFNINILNTMKKNSKVISYYFLNELVFDSEQRIVSLYIPNGQISGNVNLKSLSSIEFRETLEKIEVYSLIEHIKLIPNRKFAIILVDDNFLMMYLNVKKKNVTEFNYSLESFKLE